VSVGTQENDGQQTGDLRKEDSIHFGFLELSPDYSQGVGVEIEKAYFP
jgi:hypothetical protein